MSRTACRDSYLDMIKMGVRWYHPRIARWISADTIVPGNASGASGGLATIGYNGEVRLTPLTVGFHEGQFLTTLNSENVELFKFGPPALWNRKTRQKHIVPSGPTNPQALNRYAYCLNNPLRYVDPTGHDISITPNEWNEYRAAIDYYISTDLEPRAHRWGIVGASVAAFLGGLGAGAIGGVGGWFVAQTPGAIVGGLILAGVAGAVCWDLGYEAGYTWGGGADIHEIKNFVDWVDMAVISLENKEDFDGTFELIARQYGDEIHFNVGYFDSDGHFHIWVDSRAKDGNFYVMSADVYTRLSGELVDFEALGN